MEILELWPDYSDGPLWHHGRAVPLEDLGLPGPLADRLTDFQRAYDEDFVDDATAPASQDYWAEGRALLAELRRALADRHEIVVTEPWYGVETAGK